MTIVTPGGRIINIPERTEFNTTLEKRYKILFLLVAQLQSEHLMNKMMELAIQIDEGHPKAEEAICYYEDGIIQILEA